MRVYAVFWTSKGLYWTGIFWCNWQKFVLNMSKLNCKQRFTHYEVLTESFKPWLMHFAVFLSKIWQNRQGKATLCDKLLWDAYHHCSSRGTQVAPLKVSRSTAHGKMKTRVIFHLLWSSQYQMFCLLSGCAKFCWAVERQEIQVLFVILKVMLGTQM